MITIECKDNCTICGHFLIKLSGKKREFIISSYSILVNMSNLASEEDPSRMETSRQLTFTQHE